MQNLVIDISEQIRELEKSGKSFFYFVDNYCWIENKETGEAIPFKLWDCQKGILDNIVTALRLIILKARQLGLTWLVAAYCLWKITFFTLQLIVVISAKEDWAVEFLDRVKFIRQRLPYWMIPNVLKDTTEQLVYDHEGLNSIIKSLPTTPEGAQSKTPTLLVIDESALNRYVKKIFASSKPGLDSAKGQMIIISNAIKTGPGWAFTRDLYTRSMKRLNDFVRIFLPWNAHPLRGKNFREEQKQEGLDEEDLRQQYPETEDEAISAILGSYFGSVLAKHNLTEDGIFGKLEKIEEKIIFNPQERGIIELWKQPYNLVKDWDGFEWKERYVIGSDVSEGLGLSYSVAYVIDRVNDEIVCKMRSNRIDAHQWGDELFKLAKYYDNAYICPERTGPGITTCKRLADLRANLYIKILPAKEGKAITREIGWSESHQAKHELCGDLKTWLRLTEQSIPCATLLEELSTFIQHDNGRLEGEEGKFDDCVIGAGCTIQMSQFLKKLPQRGDKSVIVQRQKKEKRAALDNTSQAAWRDVDAMKEKLEIEREYEDAGGVW